MVEEGTLEPWVLRKLSDKNLVSRRVEKDLDKYFEARLNKKDIEQTFVPEFKTKKEALNSIETGDVFRISGDKNISIKMADGTQKELFLTPKTYLKLFPPIERFAFNQSFSFGNCYYVAGVDSINQNPNTRYKMLELFKENPDGTIDVNFSGWQKTKTGIEPKDEKSFTLKDIEEKIKNEPLKNPNKFQNMSYTCKGLMALELLREEKLKASAGEHIKNRYDEILNLENNSEDEFVPLDDFLYTKDELRAFVSFVDEKSFDDILSISDKPGKHHVSQEMIEEKLKDLEGKDDFISNYEKLILERYQRYLKNHSDEEKVLISEDFIPCEIYSHLFNKKPVYSFSGYVKDVFSDFGFKDVQSGAPYEADIKEKLMSDDKNIVFACSTTNKEAPFDKCHGYSLEPVDIDGERKFVLRNAHNTGGETLVSYDELCEYFTKIYYGV